MLSADIRLPVIASPYTYQILEFEPDAPYVQLAAATNPTACPTVTWELTSDGVANTVLDKVETTVFMEPQLCKWTSPSPTAVDWQCYLNRYDDLRATVGTTDVAAAGAHYTSSGQAEGRDNTCGQCSLAEDTTGTTMLDEVGCIKIDVEEECLSIRSDYATRIKVSPDQIHLTDTYTFYLTYTAVGGAKVTTPEITLITICGPASTTVTLPPTSSPYSYSLLFNDPDLPRVVLDDAGNSIAACPIEQWVLTADGISDTALDRLQNTVFRAGGKSTIKVDSDQVDVLGTYSFYLTYIARGGSTVTTPELRLNTKCDIGST